VSPGKTEQWLVIVTCRDEAHQVEMLRRFQREGLACRALVGYVGLDSDALTAEGCNARDAAIG
jgi:hypothetical protein